MLARQALYHLNHAPGHQLVNFLLRHPTGILIGIVFYL
jgi:hypothetical protein